MKSSVALNVMTPLLLAASLVACSTEDPAVCSSADDLRSSVDSLKDIDITSSGAVADLQAALTKIGDDLKQLKADATSEFDDEVTAAQTAFRSLSTSVDSAKADPSAATLAAVGSALSGFVTDLGTLTDDVKATC